VRPVQKPTAPTQL